MGNFPGKDLAERCGISLGIFHGFSQKCGKTMVFPWFFLAFPPLFLCFFGGFVNGLVALAEADPLGSARRSRAGPGEQLP